GGPQFMGNAAPNAPNAVHALLASVQQQVERLAEPVEIIPSSAQRSALAALAGNNAARGRRDPFYPAPDRSAHEGCPAKREQHYRRQKPDECVAESFLPFVDVVYIAADEKPAAVDQGAVVDQCFVFLLVTLDCD